LIKFDVKGDKKVKAALDRMVTKQLPFAASLALNTTITKARDNELFRSYQKTFKARNKQFFKLTHTIFNSSAKTFRTNGFVRAAIQRNEMPAVQGTRKGRTKTSVEGPMSKRRVDTSFMEFHVSGGTRRPLRSKLAVPMTVGGYKITRTKTGKVTKAKKASTLYPQAKTFVGKSSKTGKSILFVRTGKKKTKPAYHLETSVKNTRKYNPATAILQGVNTRINFEFKKAYIRAVKTGRI
jgi:hypothetical protein